MRDLTARALALHKDGMLVAEQIAERVNARIVARASRCRSDRRDTESAAGVSTPCDAQVRELHRERSRQHDHPSRTAVAVYPREQLKAVMEGLRKPPRRSKESRAVRRQAKP